MNTLELTAFIFSLIGSAIAIFCYLPGAIKVMKYNDTRSISALMFSMTCFGCLLWVIYAILMLSNYGATHNNNWSAFVGGFATLISNLGLGGFGAVILTKKLLNMNKAKKEGLTEDAWFKKHYENKDSSVDTTSTSSTSSETSMKTSEVTSAI